MPLARNYTLPNITKLTAPTRMYLNHFGLNEKPFTITPNPRFFYLSDQRRIHLTHLLYGADENGSLVILTGEPGTGKTTLCRSLQERAPLNVKFALILNPPKTPLELLTSICDEFKVAYSKGELSQKTIIDKLRKFFSLQQQKGAQSVVAIDEAQNLNAETLEQVRLLTNLETGTRKLVKIILVGQPKLNTILAKPDAQQLAQRITARYQHEPLSLKETTIYVQLRLKVAGATKKIFPPAAIKQLHRSSKGIPRMINVIGERALTGAYAMNRKKVDVKLVSEAAQEVVGTPKSNALSGFWKLAMLGGFLLATGILLSSYLTQNTSQVNISENSVPLDLGEKTNKATPPAAVVNSALLKMLNTTNPNSHALKQLFDYWGYNFDSLEGGSTCGRAKQAGLACRFTNGSIDKIRGFNRPVVLSLKDESDKAHQVLVSAINEDAITLKLAAGEQQFGQAEIESRWSGNYLLLWQPPPQGSTLLKQEQSGPDVLWLKEQLDLLEGIDPGTQQHSDLFDEDLKQRVISFQENNNLDADGIAGEETLIVLTTAIRKPEAPVLSSR